MIIRNAWICQIDDQDNVQPVFGDLEFNRDKITNITPHSATTFSPIKGADELDAQGRMLTIPQVNFHEHIYSRLAKGLPITGPMTNFVEILQNLWWKLDRTLDLEMVRASAQMAAVESLLNGVTYLFDHHASPSVVQGSLKTIADVLQEFGLRSVLTFEISDRNGPQVARQSIEENLNFFQNQANDDSKGMMGLHALFTLSDQTLQQISEVLAETPMGIHVHVAEDKADVDSNLKTYGQSIARRLQKFHLLNDRSLLIHGVHLSEQDLQIIARSKAALVFNPDSNLNNAVGLPEYAKIPADIPLLTGTDGMHANVGRSLKQVFLLHRFQGNAFENSFAFAQKIFKDQLTFVRKYFADFPRLQVNDRADFVVWEYSPPTPVTADNFWGHYLYGLLETPVNTVIQNGQILLKEQRIIKQDLPAITQNISRQGKRLFERFAQNQ